MMTEAILLQKNDTRKQGHLNGTKTVSNVLLRRDLFLVQLSTVDVRQITKAK